MVVVLSTAPAAVASALAHTLVSSRAAACVNLVPGVTSVYAWEGTVHEDAETLLVCKTDTPERLAEVLREHHPYDTPEIVVLPVDDAASDPRYVAWVAGWTGSADGGPR